MIYGERALLKRENSSGDTVSVESRPDEITGRGAVIHKSVCRGLDGCVLRSDTCACAWGGACGYSMWDGTMSTDES